MRRRAADRSTAHRAVRATRALRSRSPHRCRERPARRAPATRLRPRGLRYTCGTTRSCETQHLADRSLLRFREQRVAERDVGDAEAAMPEEDRLVVPLAAGL